MPLTYYQAQDAVKKHFLDFFKDAIDNGLPAYNIDPIELIRRGDSVPYVPNVQWQNVEGTTTTDNGLHWLRFTMRDVLTQQRAMSGGRVQDVGTRYDTQGIIIVQLFFSPSSYEDEQCRKLAFVCQQAFASTNADGVWFRNPTIVDIAPEMPFFRANVTAEYQYDSIVKG